jgi:hypothetical protein
MRKFVGALGLYLAQPVKRCRPCKTADPQLLSAVLLPGDALLSDGNTRIAAIVKRVTRSPWSHVSMYVGPLAAAARLAFGAGAEQDDAKRHAIHLLELAGTGVCAGRISDAAGPQIRHAKRFRERPGIRACAGGYCGLGTSLFHTPNEEPF